jgi:small subunit ribosomal protein S18|uniref:Small ribosomal subunit protein bS18c n=1 Tax=Chlamydomonas leiostraca TaxID=1034604 RepID=A0A1L2M597_9CHLO|nr:ribosomal protein S18 [Chlamydomonas leiostraca]APD80636.1 ribosomal protein S18 [Chlamydomonas leiostraca]
MTGTKLANKPSNASSGQKGNFSKKKDSFKDKAGASKTPGRRHVLSLSQLLGRIRKQREAKLQQQKRQIKPIIPPKSLVILLKEKPEKTVYNRRIIDYKHCGLLQRYTGLGGKILPRRQTRLSAKQQRYIAKTIKSARIMGLLPFVRKEKGFFR